tara:strand:+ start:275 stop:949 length:675 start_codon:yes stop_codon:yes gene_type:complete
MLCLYAALPALNIGLAPQAHRLAPRRCGALFMEDGDAPDFDGGALLKDSGGRMKKSVSNVQEQLATIRVGRAAPSMLDRIEVEYYGAPTPLNQLASVTAPSAQQLVIDVFDKSAMGDVEKALMMSDLGMTPNNDGKVIRLNVPQLTEDRRKELAKNAKTLGEEGKVAIRNIRRDAIDKIKKAEKTGLGKDESADLQDEIQKSLKKFEGEIESLVTQRDKEIMTL